MAAYIHTAIDRFSLEHLLQTDVILTEPVSNTKLVLITKTTEVCCIIVTKIESRFSLFSYACRPS